MPHRSVESLVEECVAQLEEISERRNALLRQMHQMIRRRDGVGSLLTLEHGDKDLDVFLERFSMTTADPDAGSITTLDESELFAPLLSQASVNTLLTPSSKGIPSNEGVTLSGRHPTVDQELHLSMPREPSPSRSFPTAFVKDGTSLLTDHPLTPSQLNQEFDDDHDELDLLRKTPPPPVASQLSSRQTSGTTRGVTSDIIETSENVADVRGRFHLVELPEPGRDTHGDPHPSEDDRQVVSGGAGDILKPPDTVSDDRLIPGDEMSIDVPDIGARQESPLEINQRVVEREGSISTGDIVMSDSAPEGARESLSNETFPPVVVAKASTHLQRLKKDDTDTIDVLNRFDYKPLEPSLPSSLVPEFVASTRRVVNIPAFTVNLHLEPEFNFGDLNISTPLTLPPTSRPRHQYKPTYTIPPVKYLHPDCNRKAKTAKQRKREKDREKSEGRKDIDWAPMGLNRWAATISANPVWRKVSRASKCLSTREWVIAMSELRLIRAIDRMEGMKREGLWSFRQPKKQRGVGGLTKTHWDHLIDEMKWMRIDFREERKWKTALAYYMSIAVLEWHAAGTMDVRIAKGICVNGESHRSGIGNVVLERTIEDNVVKVELDEDLEYATSLLGIDYGSDDGGEEPDITPDPIVDPLEPGVLIEDALCHATQSLESQNDGNQHVQPKAEREDDAALINNSGTAYADTQPEDEEGRTVTDLPGIKPTIVEFGLKSTSNDPVFGSKPTPSSSNEDAEPSATPLTTSSKTNIYSPFRQVVADTGDNQLFLDLDDLNQIQSGISAPDIHEESSPLPDLTAIFPDLQVLTLLDIPSISQSNPADGKKRSEKRSDRDDPNKRSEDTTYTRLFPTGDFMLHKPTLLGPLRPSKNLKNGHWLPLEESLMVSDIENTTKATEERMNELFDSRSGNAPSVLMALQMQAAFLKDKDNRRRTDYLWSAADDALLKSCIEKYPNNWPLISECFNASRLTVSTDTRTPRECLDRWRDRWGPDLRRSADNSTTVEDTPPPAPSQMTTRGVKRLASTSVSGASTIGMTAGSEPRKRRRHLLVQDTIRKAGKKRAEALQKQQAAQRKPPAIHETHAQYSKLPKRTPAELSRMKAEKEARELQELQLARKRQEDLSRQNLPRDHAQRMSANIPMTQPPPQQPAANLARAGGTGAGLVPAIRTQVNISQQQRIGTPSIPVGNRLSPQQILQVQVRAAAQQQPTQQVQVLAQTPSNTIALNGNVLINNSHLSPAYATRDATSSSAHVSPPHGAAGPATVNSPHQPSAQAHTLLQATQVSGNAGTRGGYYMPNVPGYTTEQIHTALRMQHQQQQAQQP